MFESLRWWTKIEGRFTCSVERKKEVLGFSFFALGRRLSEEEVVLCFGRRGEGTRGEREVGTLCFVFLTPGYSSVLAPLLPTGPKIFKFSFATCIFRCWLFEGQY